MVRFEQAKLHITGRMEKELSPIYHYHNLKHVNDVLSSAVSIGTAENISELELELLKVAVLYHDSGFLVNPDNHEALSCMIAKDALPDFGYNDKEIEVVCGLIMATKIPQTPRNHLEEIICDADLDYLGRDDFFTTGNRVFLELKERGKISDEAEWNKLQVQFLESHNYFTSTSRQLRKSMKLNFLKEVKAKLQ